MAEWGFNTNLLHGVDDMLPYGATLSPIYQTSAFRHESAEDAEKIFEHRAMGFAYSRIGNPTVDVFEKKITKLENGAASVACSSGMAALSNAFLNFLCAGDEIVSAAGLYGGTVELFHDFEKLGISVKYVADNRPEAFEELITKNTRAVFAETIGNPKLDVTDIRGVADVAHRAGVPLVVDNTIATFYLVRPLDLGADIVVNSSSKYINGSSNSISGVITYGGKFKWDEKKFPVMADFKKYGSFAYIVKLRNDTFQNMGACLSPQNAFLNIIGLETLGLRMERQCANALELSKYLDENADVDVNYPGLKKSPYRGLAEEQMDGGFGAVLTFRAGSKERAFAIIDSLKIPYIASNVGDTKTLVIHPASTIALHLSDEERRISGAYDDLVRVCVGIEDVGDLISDFSGAIESARI